MKEDEDEEDEEEKEEKEERRKREGREKEEKVLGSGFAFLGVKMATLQSNRINNR
jgi:hypothetical protein